MKNLNPDKIAVIGLVAALILSILAGIVMGSGVELQTTIASGLVGYIGRVIQEESKKSD
ncbi:MAG: hypothetical protein IJG80_09260 [Selenomonadaceae bacterium]|nr:hypothetical protein [Selenomonadaceae bacterium]MBQ3433688.1 hypothetical protein [Selenomonadaceae bacterium]